MDFDGRVHYRIVWCQRREGPPSVGPSLLSEMLLRRMMGEVTVEEAECAFC